MSRTAWSSVPDAEATLKLCLCSFLVREDALRVSSFDWVLLFCWELLALSFTL